MDRIKIEGSSNIAELGYDPKTMVLQVKFKNRSIYNYTPVTDFAYQELLKADSKGSWLHNNIIKASGVTCTKVG